MNTNTKFLEMGEMKTRLQSLWIFVMFNYLYCDLLSNMDSAVLNGYLQGQVGNIQINQVFLLTAAFLMEIPIAMVLLSWVLKYRLNRWANIIAGTIMTLVQISSLLIGIGTAPTLHYIFYSIIEATCTAVIVWFAWRWRNPESSPEKSI
jgi:hypothetical protein